MRFRNRPLGKCLALVLVGCVCALFEPVTTLGDSPAESTPRFEADVLPILTAHCLKCHGREARKASLDMRTTALLARGGDSGPVVTAGKGKESPLYQRIEDKSMPPEGELPLTPAQIDTLRRWIDSGAAAAELAASDAATAPEPVAEEISAAERDFWVFRKPQRHQPPAVQQVQRVRTPVDAFVLAQLEERGLEFSPDAPLRALISRAYFDLIGLPPSPAEIEQFLSDPAPEAYERLLDRLLASPHFGERWGRHWLDAAGYVDVNGGDNDAGIIKLSAGKWRYRDYVIRSFNDDKPLDQFLTEQLAGDELEDWRAAEHFTPHTIERLVATTFLRASADDTEENELNTADIRHGVLARTIETVTSNLLGLTVNCARCHSHKYDPIPHRDYYRLTAIFTPALNPQSWLQPSARALADIAPREKAAALEHNAAIDRQIEDAKRRLAEIRQPYRQRIVDAKLASLPENIRADTKEAIATAADKRNEVQKYLAGKFAGTVAANEAEITAALSEADRAPVAAIEKQLDELPQRRQSWGTIQAMYDVGPPPTTFLLKRGNHETPGAEVAPGFLSVLNDEKSAELLTHAQPAGTTSGRRLALARWLTERNTLAAGQVARVLANRAWQHLFGVGIVETADNFGRSGARPTHPELLDWLALQWFEDGYRLKPFLKRLMLSTAYRQSSAYQQPAVNVAAKTPAESADTTAIDGAVAVANLATAVGQGFAAAPTEAAANAADPMSVDPGNRLLWRQRLRRLESEAIRDRILATSGKLDTEQFGPPIAVDPRPDGSVVVKEAELPTPTAKWRRSIYILARRNYHLSMLGVFDQPVVATNCPRRNSSAVVLQSLAMLNDDFVVEQSRFFAERTAAAPQDEWVPTAFRLALGRPPSDQEQAWCQELLARQTERFLRVIADEEPMRSETARRQALAHLCQMLLNTSEFLYVP